MLDFKKTLLIASALIFPLEAKAQEQQNNTGYYIFSQMRYFGPKLDTQYFISGIDENDKSAQRFYPNIAKHQYAYLKNSARTIKDAMGYGDWDKPYRVMMGHEYDYRHSKTSSSSYGYEDRSNSLFLLADKGYYNNYVRFGGGLSVSKYESEYDNGIEKDDHNILASLYGIYNDAPNQIRLRSRLHFGYGNSDLERKTVDGVFKDDINTFYYGFDNTLSQTFQSGIFFLQPQVELNGLGISHDEISEHGNPQYAFDIKDKNQFSWEGIVELYLGIKGKDNFNNSYSFKFGPSLTRIFSDPYDSFYGFNKLSGDEVFFKARRDKRDYMTWKAYFTYKLENGLGWYSDFRYYQKDKDSISYALGVNYNF